MVYVVFSDFPGFILVCGVFRVFQVFQVFPGFIGM